MISNTYANKILNLACGVKDEMTMPDYLYLGLSKDEPDRATGVISTSSEDKGEPAKTTVPSYKRVVVGGKSANIKYFSEASGGSISNNKEIHFDAAKQTFGLMKWFFLSTSETGPAIMWGQINGENGVDINVDDGEVVPVFYVGDLQASIDLKTTE